MNRFRVVDPPVPERPPVAPGRPFAIHYKVENTTANAMAARMDHILIRDRDQFPVQDLWCPAGPLERGAASEGRAEAAALREGTYELWLTLDSQGAWEQECFRLVVGEGQAPADPYAPAPGAAGQGGQYAHTYHVGVVTAPGPVEPIRAGENFQIR